MDVGPLYGGDRPIRESDRQLVANLLTAAHADGRLTAFDLSTRMSQVYLAQYFDDLVVITRDLMA